jgi:hypothetical protein
MCMVDSPKMPSCGAGTRSTGTGQAARLGWERCVVGQIRVVPSDPFSGIPRPHPQPHESRDETGEADRRGECSVRNRSRIRWSSDAKSALPRPRRTAAVKVRCDARDHRRRVHRRRGRRLLRLPPRAAPVVLVQSRRRRTLMGGCVPCLLVRREYRRAG